MKVLFFSLCFNNFLYSQWLNEDTLKLKYRIEELKLNEPNELYYASNGNIYMCDVLYKNDDTSNFIVEYFFREEYENLIFFHLKYKDKREIYGSFGKYQKEYDGDKFQCWVEELMWYYFDENKKLKEIKFYEHGSLVKFR